MKLCAPHFAGGYGVRDMVFNQQIDLSNSAIEICGQISVYPDLSNAFQKLVIKHDSEAFHEN